MYVLHIRTAFFVRQTFRERQKRFRVRINYHSYYTAEVHGNGLYKLSKDRKEIIVFIDIFIIFIKKDVF